MAKRNPATHPYAALGRRIAAARDGQFTQRELAGRVGISEGYMPAIETGRRRPDAVVLRAIARELRLDYNELAELAGYLPKRTSNGEDIHAPSAVAPYIRRMLQYPAEVWQALELTAGAWVTGQKQPDSAANDEAHETREAQPPPNHS